MSERKPLTHLRRVDSSATTPKFGPVYFQQHGVWLVLLLLCCVEIPVINAVHPDQTTRSVTSDPGLHCLPITLLGVSRLKWVTHPTTTVKRLPRDSLASLPFVYLFTLEIKSSERLL